MHRLLILTALAIAPAAAAAQTAPTELSRRPVTPTSDENAFLPIESLEALVGRIYYLLDDDATCRASDPDRTRIRTWRQKIEFLADRVLVWGVLCNDAATELPPDTARMELRVSPSRDAVLYRDQRLTYAPTVLKLCEAGLWCPVSGAGP